jgi:hypothetical protein
VKFAFLASQFSARDLGVSMQDVLRLFQPAGFMVARNLLQQIRFSANDSAPFEASFQIKAGQLSAAGELLPSARVTLSAKTFLL